jgi:hypothetical protein
LHILEQSWLNSLFDGQRVEKTYSYLLP